MGLCPLLDHGAWGLEPCDLVMIQEGGLGG